MKNVKNTYVQNGEAKNAQVGEYPIQDGDGLLCGKKLTVPQASKVMGIGETTMRELLRTGDIPVLRILGKILILERDLENYLHGHYGTLTPSHKSQKQSNDLTPLPKFVQESSLLKKVS